jgi:hypothetical protein
VTTAIRARRGGDDVAGLSRHLWRELLLELTWLAGIGAAAVGVSGLIAWGMGAVFGKSFVSGDPADVTYTAARCRDLFEYAPHAKTCEQAAVVHHFGEIVFSRLALGVLGLVVLGGYALLRRRVPVRAGLLPDGFAVTIGASLTGAAAAALLLSSLGSLAFGNTRGVGGTLSGGIVSLMLAVWFGASLYRTLRQRGR